MRSKAKHTSIKQYYTRVNAVENLTLDSDQITYPPPTLIDKAKTAEYGQKVAESLASQYDERLKNHTVKASKNSAKQEDKLNGLRQQYASANQQGKEKLAPAILDLEKRILQMNEELDALGVSVRNAEKTKSK
mgnify:CR=1 FL=1